MINCLTSGDFTSEFCDGLIKWILGDRVRRTDQQPVLLYRRSMRSY